LAAAMRLIDDDDVLTRRLGRAARLESDRYSADVVVPAIEEIYSSVLDRAKAGAA
jgi:hypothetical protein